MISFLIDDVSRLQRAALDQVLKPIGASRAQWALMSEISRRPGLKQIELAQELDLSRVAITQLVEKLQARGLVRITADEADRRAKRIVLSTEGAALLKKIRQAGLEFLAEISGGAPQPDREAMLRQLDAMKARLLGETDQPCVARRPPPRRNRKNGL